MAEDTLVAKNGRIHRLLFKLNRNGFRIQSLVLWQTNFGQLENGLRISSFRMFLMLGIFLATSVPCVACQDSEKKPGKALTAQQLLQQQELLTDQFKQLERKLFELYQMERESRPQRAELLRQMYELAQQNNTVGRMSGIVAQIRSKNLREAQQAQGQALGDLKLLMEILQKEDENQRLKELKKQQQENLREVNRLLQLQNRLKDEAIESAEPQSLSESQEQLAEQTKALKVKVDVLESDGEIATQDLDVIPLSADDSNQPSDSPTLESERSADQDSDADEHSQKQKNSSSQQSSDSELSKRLESAQQRMAEAKEKLEEAKKVDAAEEMRKAIEQLEAAKKELEDILKQAREEEMMSTLARLEDQFRKMLENQLRINQVTSQLDQVPEVGRGPDHEIAAAKLSGDQRKNGMNSLRVSMVLRDDSSSIALAVTVQQLTEDMNTISDRLIVADTGGITQQFQQDVVASLELLIESVVKAQEDVQNQAQQDQPSSGEPSDPGEMPLVDQIAELKMLKGLQQRILRRHRMIADEFRTGQDPLGTVTDEAATTLLRKLEKQQSRLFEMTREMVKQIK